VIHYWYTLAEILSTRRLLPSVSFNDPIRRALRVLLFDTDGLRVMTASRYPVIEPQRGGVSV
jgi:hypothetical protein